MDLSLYIRHRSFWWNTMCFIAILSASFFTLVYPFTIPSINFFIDWGGKKNRLYMDVLTHADDRSRIDKMANSLFKTQLFTDGTFSGRFVVPHGDNLKISKKYNVVETPCSTTKNGMEGLVCRMSAGFKDFVERGVPWYYRANDDSYINPLGMDSYLDDLEELVDPFTDVIIKGFLSMDAGGYDYFAGGAGMLFSRAAIMVLIRNEMEKLSNHTIFPFDDTTISTAVTRIFGQTLFYDETRIGSICQDSQFEGQIAHWVDREFKFKELPECNMTFRHSHLKSLIGWHTKDKNANIKMILNSHLYPEEVFIEYQKLRSHKFCKMDQEHIDEYLSLQNLADRTPIIKEDDVRDPLFTDEELRCLKYPKLNRYRPLCLGFPVNTQYRFPVAPK